MYVLRFLQSFVILESLQNSIPFFTDRQDFESRYLLIRFVAIILSVAVNIYTSRLISSNELDVGNKPVAFLLGVDVKHVLVGTQEGQNGIITPAAPSNVFSDSELDDPINQNEDKSNEKRAIYYFVIKSILYMLVKTK
jgi:hypothetical protein